MPPLVVILCQIPALHTVRPNVRDFVGTEDQGRYAIGDDRDDSRRAAERSAPSPAIDSLYTRSDHALQTASPH